MIALKCFFEREKKHFVRCSFLNVLIYMIFNYKNIVHKYYIVSTVFNLWSEICLLEHITLPFCVSSAYLDFCLSQQQQWCGWWIWQKETQKPQGRYPKAPIIMHKVGDFYLVISWFYRLTMSYEAMILIPFFGHVFF